MHIAYVTGDRHIPVFGNKGASVHVQEMVRAFSDLSHHVSLVAARRGAPPLPVAANIIEVAEAVSILDEKTVLDGDEKARAKERSAMRISNAIRDKLVTLHSDRPFDFIYERYSLFSTAGLLAAREIGVPYILEVNSPLVLEQKKFRRLFHVIEAADTERKVFAGADVLLAVSREVERYAISKGARANRTHVMPNAVDTSRFHPTVAPHVIERARGKFTVGFVGSLKPWHGVDVLLDAFRQLAGASEQYHLLIVGDGPLRGWIEGYLRGAGLGAFATLTGWQSNDDLPGRIRSMDVAVAPYPKLENFYFSPLKLYEYMSVGTPVVASGIGQIAEVLRDGETGLLVHPGDSSQLAQRIEHLFMDERLRRSIGAAAARAVSNRTWRRNAERVIAMATPLLVAA